MSKEHVELKAQSNGGKRGNIKIDLLQMMRFYSIGRSIFSRYCVFFPDVYKAFPSTRQCFNHSACVSRVVCRMSNLPPVKENNNGKSIREMRLEIAIKLAQNYLSNKVAVEQCTIWRRPENFFLNAAPNYLNFSFKKRKKSRQSIAWRCRIVRRSFTAPPLPHQVLNYLLLRSIPIVLFLISGFPHQMDRCPSEPRN